ncbi:hypothetical protein [Modicisalibacter ilicicola]|nr:hypothetical protein [Halomonas ilicicola]
MNRTTLLLLEAAIVAVTYRSHGSPVPMSVLAISSIVLLSLL